MNAAAVEMSTNTDSYRVNLNMISRIFTPQVIDAIIEKGYSPYLRELFKNCSYLQTVDRNISLYDFFNKVYDILFQKYRNEYIYKNTIAKKVVLGRHSLKTTQMLTEFRIGESKADVLIINGTSTAYEIKSEYDSFVRLHKQLEDYLKGFDHVNVITTEDQAIKLASDLPPRVGLLQLTKRGTISICRESISNKKYIKPDLLFDSLRKKEYMQVIKAHYGYVPDLPNTRIFTECKSLFTKLDPETAHDLSMSVIRQRKYKSSLESILTDAPDSLLAYFMSSVLQHKKLMKLSQKFSDKIGTLLEPVLEV